MASSDTTYTDLLEHYAQVLVQKTLEKVKPYEEKRQFKEALEILYYAQATYNCNDFDNLIKQYEGCLPLRLVDCYIVSEDFYDNEDTSGYDSYGNEHTESVIFDGPYDAYVVYNLDQRFVLLSGAIIHDNGRDEEVKIKMYLDDTLIYETERIVKTTPAINFSVDTTGGSLLRIEFVFYGPIWSEGGCIIDATLS